MLECIAMDYGVNNSAYNEVILFWPKFQKFVTKTTSM